MNKNIEGDTLQEGYNMMKKYSKELKGVHGISCEVGLRKGLGSKSMMEGFVENNDKRPHIAVDPYGDIIMLNDRNYGGSVRCGFDNKFKMEAIVPLYEWAFNNGVNFIFLPLEDVEFFKRFSDGVPIYENEKTVINNYCYIHVDGPHTYDAAKNACDFFLDKMLIKSIIAFDNCDHYDHDKIENILKEKNFSFIEEYIPSHKKFYRKN